MTIHPFHAIRAHLDALLAQRSEVLDWGYTALPAALAGAEKLDQWLQAGHQAGMDWMTRTAELRKHPQDNWEDMTTALVVLWRYPSPLPRQPGWIAAYAQGPDYHVSIGTVLRDWCQDLAQRFPGLHSRPFVDSLPLAERELAVRAGLGWIGRHTLLIHPRHGSAFFIAGLLLNVNTENEPAAVRFAKGCASCRRCLDACPAQAITEENGVDARRCISYLTIEHRGDFSAEQASWAGHGLFGCDICQTVCPYNKKHLADSVPFWPTEPSAWLDKAPKGQGLARMLRDTPLERAGRKGLLRNLQAWAVRHDDALTAQSVDNLRKEDAEAQMLNS